MIIFTIVHTYKFLKNFLFGINVLLFLLSIRLSDVFRFGFNLLSHYSCPTYVLHQVVEAIVTH